MKKLDYSSWIQSFRSKFREITGIDPITDLADHDWYIIYDESPYEPEKTAMFEAARYKKSPFEYDDDIYFNDR